MVEGKSIKEVRTMTEEEAEREGWGSPRRKRLPAVIVLEDGTLLYPSRDSEGNEPGGLFGYNPNTDETFAYR